MEFSRVVAPVRGSPFVPSFMSVIFSADLKEIVDYRGSVVWIKTGDTWANRTINKIGENLKNGEKLSSDLTESERAEITIQMEKERISKLTTAQVQAEKESKTASLVIMASNMRSGLEIQKDSQALKKSQDYYNTELAKINELYS